jgi:hypothetical protein
VAVLELAVLAEGGADRPEVAVLDLMFARLEGEAVFVEEELSSIDQHRAAVGQAEMEVEPYLEKPYC